MLCYYTQNAQFSYHQQHCYTAGFCKDELNFLGFDLKKKKKKNSLFAHKNMKKCFQFKNSKDLLLWLSRISTQINCHLDMQLLLFFFKTFPPSVYD